MLTRRILLGCLAATLFTKDTSAMNPFGSGSAILFTPQTIIYTCPPGCRVVISDIIFNNTFSAAAQVGFWVTRSGVNAVTMNNRSIPAQDNWLSPFKVFLNEGDSISGTTTVSGWVVCSFNYTVIEQLNGAIPSAASYDPPGIFSDTTGKVVMPTPLVLGQRTKTSLTLGQSMVSNNVMDATGYVAGNVANLHTNGIFYRASGALLGTGGVMPDNCLSRFGDKIIGNGKADRVNIINRSIGSTNPQDFAKSGWFAGVISLAASNLRAINQQVDFVDLEWGSLAAVNGMSAADFSNGIRSVVSWLRENGIYAPVFVAKHTRFNTASITGAQAVRAGVDQSLSAALGIFLGPDMDVIPDTERQAGAHLLMTGADHSAQLRYDNRAAFFGW